MASNPMKKKATISFIQGMAITIILFAIIGVALYFLVLKDRLATTGGNGVVAYVYKIKAGINLQSGQEITPDMVEEVKLSTNVIPGDAIFSKIENEQGELIGVSFAGGQKCKIALREGTVLGQSMLYEDGETDASLRRVELNMLTLQSTVSVGEYIDVRLLMPTGEDYIVLSKKRVESIMGETIGLNLTEEEIVTISAAIIDAYTAKTSNLYLVKYVDPGLQKESQRTYMVKASILQLMQINPNILTEARAALSNRWNTGGGLAVRNEIDATLGQYDPEEVLPNIQEKMEEQIKASKDLYLQGLQGY